MALRTTLDSGWVNTNVTSPPCPTPDCRIASRLVAVHDKLPSNCTFVVSCAPIAGVTVNAPYRRVDVVSAAVALLTALIEAARAFGIRRSAAAVTCAAAAALSLTWVVSWPLATETDTALVLRRITVVRLPLDTVMHDTLAARATGEPRPAVAVTTD